MVPYLLSLDPRPLSLSPQTLSSQDSQIFSWASHREEARATIGVHLHIYSASAKTPLYELRAGNGWQARAGRALTFAGKIIENGLTDMPLSH